MFLQDREPGNGETVKEWLFSSNSYAPAPAARPQNRPKPGATVGPSHWRKPETSPPRPGGWSSKASTRVQARQLDRAKKGHANAPTLEAVALEWLALKDWTETTKAKPLDMLKRVVFPRIGGIPVVQVTPPGP